MRNLSAILLLLAAAAHARKPAPLPEFSLVTTDGKTVNSAQLHLPNHWLLIYVHANSGNSAVVLDALKKEPPSALNGKVLVIVGGASAKDIAPMAAAYPHMQTLTWYGDPRFEALRALKLPGSPSVLGIRQDTIQWMFTGSLPDRDRLASILTSWKDAKDTKDK